jgi:hypothetical protein
MIPKKVQGKRIVFGQGIPNEDDCIAGSNRELDSRPNRSQILIVCCIPVAGENHVAKVGVHVILVRITEWVI